MVCGGLLRARGVRTVDEGFNGGAHREQWERIVLCDELEGRGHRGHGEDPALREARAHPLDEVLHREAATGWEDV